MRNHMPGLRSALLIFWMLTALAVQAAESLQIQFTPLGPWPSRILDNAISNDGHHLALATRQGSKVAVIVDGQPGPEYDGIAKGTPVFSADGRRVAYGAQKGQKQFMVVDGQPGPEYDAIGNGSLVFSADGRRVAYAAKKGQNWLVGVDGQPGPE